MQCIAPSVKNMLQRVGIMRFKTGVYKCAGRHAKVQVV